MVKKSLFALLLVVGGVSAVHGSWVRYTYFGLPEVAVIGTLDIVKKDAVFRDTTDPNGDTLRHYWSTGKVVVEEVLEGDPEIKEILVIWQSRVDNHPPVEGLMVLNSGNRKFEGGEKRIWVLLGKGRFDGELASHHSFQELSLDQLETVKSELTELRLEAVKPTAESGEIE